MAIKGLVVNDEEDPLRRRWGTIATFIFLEGGMDEGFAPNQILSVMANPFSRNPNSKYEVSPRAVALIKIVRVAEDYSTALVLASRDAIRVGDYTASPDQFLEFARFVRSLEVVDITDPNSVSDPWEPFRPFMSEPVPLSDYEKARRIPLDQSIDFDDQNGKSLRRSRKKEPEEEFPYLPDESDPDVEEVLVDEGE